MNRENMLRAIEMLENLSPDQPEFNMEVPIRLQNRSELWMMEELEIPSCKSAACIAGHIALAFRDEMPADQIMMAAGAWLGLDDEKLTHLFCGFFTEIPFDQITAEDAVIEMRRMLD